MHRRSKEQGESRVVEHDPVDSDVVTLSRLCAMLLAVIVWLFRVLIVLYVPCCSCLEFKRYPEPDPELI